MTLKRRYDPLYISRPRSKRRAFLLMVVLGASVLMLVLGMAYLGTARYRYETAVRIPQTAQARALAEAGIEDARVKFQKDIEFPPHTDKQPIFSYTESMRALDGSFVGSYQVTIDMTHAQTPFLIARLESIGTLQDSQGRVICSRRLGAEMDLASTADRKIAPPPVTNPNYYRIIRWKDYGSL